MPVYNANNEVLFKETHLEMHPCFNKKARHSYARIHLPVAPQCNVQCKFCDRKYSCVNESRPGVTASVMTPEKALEHLERNLATMPNIRVVGIAGPGDPFANPEETLETLRLVRKHHPDYMLCVSSNGLNVLPYVDELKKLKVSHVTITVNAVDSSVGTQIYEWMRWKDQTLRGKDAAALLWENQQLSIQALDFRDILVKVNSVCIPGVNSYHIEDIARTVAGLGASLHNVIPLIPVPNTAFANLAEPRAEEIRLIRLSAQRYLPQMEHCSRCRADAVGLLTDVEPKQQTKKEEEITMNFAARLGVIQGEQSQRNSGATFKPGRPYIAVASQEGVLVNMHLGKASAFRIYAPGDNKPVLVDLRQAPSAGGGDKRWAALSELLKDCAYLLVSGAGPIPKSILVEHGIKVKIVEGYIQDIITNLARYQGNIVENGFSCGGPACQSEAHVCGEYPDACNGSVQGCGKKRPSHVQAMQLLHPTTGKPL